MDFVKTRAVLVKILIYTLIAAASVAVVSILIGGVYDIVGRILATFGAAIVYILVLIGILKSIPAVGDEQKPRSDLFVINSLLVLVCTSYITVMLGIWNVLGGGLAGKLQWCYFVLLCGALYAKPLINVETKAPQLSSYVYVNYGFIALACLLICAAIIAPSEWGLWNGLVGRCIAASIVIDATLSMIIVVLYHLYLQDHPEMRQNVKGRSDELDDESVDEIPRRHLTGWQVAGIIILVFIMLKMLSVLSEINVTPW